MDEWRLRGKDDAPLRTVEHIKEILDKAGIKTKYSEGEISINGCCYSRLCMDMPYGNLFGTNGKGMTRELCMASAYGEFMERIQNLIFAAALRNDDPGASCLYPEDAPFYDPGGDFQPDCIAKIKKSVAASITAPSFLTTAEEMTDSIIKDLAFKVHEGKFPMELFYSVREGRAVYLPSGLIQMFIFSNGMAAGNTIAEAMVEGISEIFERYSQIAFYRGGITPPPIPDTEIDKWPRIRGLIDEVEKSGRYKVELKDCSLGRDLPVACAVFRDTETGGFGVKFGAHPDMGVAMERTFTEAMQGKPISQAANCNTATFITDGPGERAEKWNSIKVGFGRVPAHLLNDTPDYPFKPWKSVSGKNNSELVREMISLAESMGGDVYIKDNSFLGFPAVCIYIAGISEAKPVDALTLKEQLLQNSVSEMFENPASLSNDQVGKMLILARMKSGAVLENTISAISGYRSLCPVKGLIMETCLLEMACCYYLGNYDGALSCIDRIEAGQRDLGGDPETNKYFIGVRLYIEAKKSGTSLDMARAVIALNCGEETACRIEEEYSEPSMVLARLFASPAIKEEACRQYKTISETYRKLAALKCGNQMSEEYIENTFKKIGL
jgi:ribosomal protein S12 methylthiotransferase accessory factor